MNIRSWLANGVVLFTVVTCTRLGFWQLDRWDQKTTEAERRQEQHRLPPLTLLAAEQVKDYRKVRLQGHFTAAMVATGGVRYRLNGYAALGVFQPRDGHKVLVLRGWIPSDDWTPYLEVPDETELVGVLQTFEGPADVEPIAHPRTGDLVWPLGRQPFLWMLSRGVGISWPSIAKAHQVEIPAVVVVGPELPTLDVRKTDVLPAGGYSVWLPTEHHHHYALQWFAFALIAAGLRLFVWWRNRRR